MNTVTNNGLLLWWMLLVTGCAATPAATATRPPSMRRVDAPAQAEDPDGDGVLGARDLCPNDAEDRDEVADYDGCPEVDQDCDGLADQRDRCPVHREDRDGFEDDDGCPEHDNDRDRVADRCDDCPNTAADAQDVDGRGCSMQQREPSGIVLLISHERRPTVILFDADSASVDYRDNWMHLTMAARTIIESERIVVVTLTGHATRDEEHSERLALARAEAVRDRLVQLGVEPERLAVESAGTRGPVDTTRTAAGRARNRRVEFRVTQAPPSEPDCSLTPVEASVAGGCPLAREGTAPPR